ncbi:MAG TPA: glycosyltransferase family 4 protein [Stellaceae bacterium]|nr:glycosyltransferase family 4 protein [Stellaceae bacterium]
MTPLHVNHVLSTCLLTSRIFADLIDRAAATAPPATRITSSDRPDRRADVWHYHRPNLEWRLLPRSVVTVHHDLRDERAWMTMRSFLARYREAAAVHCLNRTQAAILAEHGIAPARVIPHGVDRRVLPVPTEPRRVSGSRLCLGICSRRHPSGIKGEDRFLALLGHLDPTRISFVLVGGGRGPDAREARAKGFDVAHWERLPYPLMAEIYRRIDALLILSSFEGGPASLPEALGSGVPVICTDVGMCPDFVRDGVNGLVLTGRPSVDGARIMALLDADGRGLRVLNDGAFAAAPTIPSWEEVMAEWHQLYRKAALSAA